MLRAVTRIAILSVAAALLQPVAYGQDDAKLLDNLRCYAETLLLIDKGFVVDTLPAEGLEAPGLVVDEVAWRAMPYAEKQRSIQTFVCGMANKSPPVEVQRLRILSDMTHHELGAWSAWDGLTVAP